MKAPRLQRPGPAGPPPTSADRALKRLLPRTLTRVRPSADWRWALVETVAVMAVAIAFSALVRPDDPLWTASPFPWLWLVAAVLALRYGSAHAVVAMGIALVGWLLLDALRAPLGDFPRVSFLGGLVLALVAGEFSDVWNARLNQGQSVNAYLDERLKALTQSHYLLSVSHDRLEQELLARPFTLRETLFTVRQVTRQRSRTAAEPLPAGDWLLTLVAQACRLEAAALYALRDGKLEAAPVALYGKFGAAGDDGRRLDLDDPMLAAALQTGELMHVQSEPFIETDRPSRYVACAPLVASSGQVLGVLAVERMAFTALTLETLQFLTVLLAYYADSLEHGEGVQAIRAVFERCSDDFATELVRLQRLFVTAFVRSSLVAFALPADARVADEWVTRFERLRRSIDLAWLAVAGERRDLLLLLPLTHAQGVDGYVDRIQRAVREQYGTDLGAAGIAVRSAELDGRPPVEQLQAFLGRADA
jgi:hypothetical protein